MSKNKLKTVLFQPDNVDEEKERIFHLEYLRSLTTEERFRLMFERSILMIKMLKNGQNRRTGKNS